MRDGKADEIERLEEGLAQAGDDWLPKAIEAEFEPMSPEDLLDLAQLGDRLEDAVKIRNGWIYLMLKRKVGHKNFQKYLEDHKRSYWRARDCMNYARAAARHPALAGALAGRALRHILALPEPEIRRLEEAITGIPADEVKKITRHWIEKEYRNVQKEKGERGKKRKKKLSEEPLPERNTDAVWVTVRDRWGEAVAAMCRLVKAAESVKMKREYFDEVFDLKMCEQLGHQLDLLGEILTPYEEHKRRGLNEE